MRRRLLFTLATLLIIASIVLVIGIVMLYSQAEKQQANIFDSEVQRAGYNAVDKISDVMEGKLSADTIPVPPSPDSVAEVYFQKFVRQYLIDTAKNRRIGFVKGVIDFERNAVIPLDTLYYDTLYRNDRENIVSRKWEADIDVVQYGELHSYPAAHAITLPVEMDSAVVSLLDRRFLYRVIKSALTEQGVDADFDFAVYTSYNLKFVVAPQYTSTSDILKSKYFFRLKSNEKFIAPYYLIIYFPTVRTYLLQRMSFIVGTIALFLVIILIIASITLFSLYRQKKIADIKNDFIDNMTHELKTPIATISLVCDAFHNENMLEDKESRLAYINIIKNENTRLQNMVTNVLRTAQLRRGQIMMDVGKVDMHEIVNRVVDSVALQVKSRNGSMILNLDAENAVIYADGEHIRNVVVNIVENALKYSEDAPQITISTRNDEKHFFLSVKDCGIGISKKNIRHIFDDFYRVPTGNLHNVKGYGLGLSYVKKIVSLHGGSVHVESEQGKGTEFMICLPIKHK